MEMTNEKVACQVHAVLMEPEPEPEPEPVSRLRTKYRSLRRQVCLMQSISVLFCFSCCLFTLLYHAFLPTCKENGTKEALTFGMQYQGAESHSREDTIPTERSTSFTRLTVKDNVRFTKEEGYVPWMYTPEYPKPNHTRYFILDDDNESLKVLQGGTYKVSLQITYRKFSENTGEIFLQHDIRHYTDEYDRPLPLLTHWETVNLKYWRKSLFSEGIFSLKSGDRLKVWSKNRNLIDVGGTISQKTAFVAYPHFST
ncbi:uncharacterized protein LOC107676624 [Sinocyclocheilus anshuiensis]|uniref:uncharacterized protein LOC107676624 n=1 Tax=Sinocyclocheilus anshuiensis TaxID=1608454 RepID=UPI0007BAA9C3|nr:PREDICTED: uncharacterized protein LOC107676624 [Sinocyclocheilus anshuiensis]